MGVSGRGARQKGKRAEREFALLATEKFGVPTQLIIASGAIRRAEGDCKIGVKLTKGGEFPPPDESICLLRGEVKNVAAMGSEKLWAVVDSGKRVTKLLEKAVDQSQMTTVVLVRRNKIPSGALKDPSRMAEAWLATMGADDFLNLVKEVITLRKENKKLKRGAR